MSQTSINIVKLVEKKISELLPENNGKLIIALSGGGDSLALAHIMLKLSKIHGYDICAYHLNHGLRGDESDNDANFVKNWCKEKSIELRIEKADDIESFRQKHNYSLEEAARWYRYDRIAKYASEIDAQAVLTGHTIDDDVETFLLRCVTGASLNSLAGIHEKTEFQTITIIRPLLTITKTQLREYLKDNNETWREDSTNFEPDALRNLVRLDVILYLDKVFERNVSQALGKTITNLKRERELLDELIDIESLIKDYWIHFKSKWKEGYLAKASKLRNANSALRYRILLWALDELGLDIKRRKEEIFNLIDDFISLKGGKKHHHIGNDIYLARSGKVLAVAKVINSQNEKSFDPLASQGGDYIKEIRNMSESAVTKIESPGTYRLGDVEITVESVAKTDIKKSSGAKEKDIVTEYFDPSILHGGIELVFGATITGHGDKHSSTDMIDEYNRLGNRTLIDQWVKWPVLKKEDEIIWIIGVCRRSAYNELSGEKAVKISAKMPSNIKLFI